jgi:hypothetical protein
MMKFTADDVDVHSDHEPGATYYDSRDVDSLLAAIPAYLLDPLDSHYCEPLAAKLRSLTGK